MTTPSEAHVPRELPVTLKTHDQRTLSVQRRDDGTVSLVAGGAPATFRLVMMDPDLFALRVQDGAGYLSIRGDSAQVSPDVGTHETFQLVQSADPQFFRFRNLGVDRHLVVNAEGAGAAELFTFEPAPLEETEVHRSCCCGPALHAHGESGVAVWNEQTHFRIVELAVHLLGHMRNPTREATFVHDVWQAGNAQHIRAGLKGADEWDDWKPTHPIWAMYYYHFYNHDDDRSFPWPKFVYPHHAVSKGEETFNSSVARYRSDPDKRQACIDLGLSLHYLTDLCQPMHAANFINWPPNGDWRHAGYEDYAEDYVVNRNFFRLPDGYPPLDRSEVEDTSATPSGWLKAVSVQSLTTWKEVLSKEASRKVEWRHTPWGPIPYYINKWGSEADASLMRSLWLAPRNTARYLCLWANRVRR